MKRIQLSKASVHSWSGGTTTELFIYPEGSSFAKRDFTLRISIATVETNTSVFTPFPNTNRTLLVLEGTQRLEHQGAHTAHLKALEQDTFSGNWTTHCTGTSRNFNVMTAGTKEAKVTVQTFAADETVSFENTDGCTFVYLLYGEAIIGVQSLHPSEGVVLNTSQNIDFKAPSQAVVVVY